MKRNELLEIIRGEGGLNKNGLVAILLTKLKGDNIHVSKGTLQATVAKMKQKFEKHQRSYKRLIDNEKEWLFVDMICEEVALGKEAGPGRPTTSYEASSNRTKRRKVAKIANQHT